MESNRNQQKIQFFWTTKKVDHETAQQPPRFDLSPLTKAHFFEAEQADLPA